MTHLTIPQIADAWITAGGNTGDQTTIAVAVALAESGGWTTAVSPSADYGVWQINIVHRSQFPNLWPQRFNAVASAKMAKAISGNGMDWGPWCTAWADPANCGHYLGPVLQHGSPAYSHLAHVAAVLGASPPVEHYPPGFGQHVGGDAWSRIQHIMGDGGAGWHDTLQATHAYLKGYAQ